ncbi:nascent polypeptide-associated complex subunit alpha, muscle-specific form-like isoform X2 [Zonotrichia leucophrys gambelii]|uniref:nascent polypeptide-associated complex subunit alpha, muscle-specific form-like isoform X2 n=1 Tax=Zonotrichia leucophrys gambelii TaxID=257770 RepID=UPI003140525A
MERPRLPLPRPRPPLPRLLAAAVLVECCARLCPALGSGTGSALSAADPCAHLGPAAGERCRTDRPQPGVGTGQPGAGAGQPPTPGAGGQLWTEAGPPPFPGTPAGTPELSSPQQSPGGPGLGRNGTGPAARGGAATEPPGPAVSAGWEQPAPPSPAAGTPAPEEAHTDPATTHPPDPLGHVTAEGATNAQGTLLHSPPSVTVPGSAGGQWSSSSSLLGWRATGTALVQSQNDTVQLGDSSPGTLPSTVLATDSSGTGTAGTSPFAGGLQRLLAPTGTLQGMPGLSGGQGFAPHPREGPRSAPQPSALSPGPGASPLASTAWPAEGTGPASLPATRRGSALPLPTSMASTPGVTSPGQGGALDLTTGVLGPPDGGGAPEHGHIPLSPSAIPGQPPVPPAPGSPAVAQGGVTHTSPGSPHMSLSPQSAPASGSAVTLLSAPLPSPGTSWGLLGFSPTVGTPLGDPSPGLPHSSPKVGPAESLPSLGGTQVGVGSLAPPSAPGPPQQPALSQPAPSPGPTTAVGVTSAAVTATITAATSPEGLWDTGTVTAEPHPAVLQRDVQGVTWASPAQVPTVMPGPPQQPPDSRGGGPGSPPAAVDTELARPSSSPRGRTDPDTPQVTPAGVGRAPQVFIVEDQPPLLRAPLLRIPCQLVLDMAFVPALQDPGSPERQELLHSFNETVTPLFTPVPGFLRLEVTGIRKGSVVLSYDALFAAEQLPGPGLDELLEAALGSARARPGLALGTAPVLRHEALARPLEPCALLFTCPSGFACASGADGNVTCTSLCHRAYCKNHGICSHGREQPPRCQCPVGSDFWFMGLRCDYRVTQQGLLGTAAGVLLSIVLLGAVLAALAVRRFKALLLEARADQTRSSYRRFCRLDDVSAQYWSCSGLPSASSLDNPAFSNSEELLQLQVLDSCGCRGGLGGAKRGPGPCAHPQCQPSFHYEWDTSSSSMNDPMVDSGKASDISVSSWPTEPIQWAPFPLHQLSRQRPHKARWPQSLCEGLELGTLERSWTA